LKTKKRKTEKNLQRENQQTFYLKKNKNIRTTSAPKKMPPSQKKEKNFKKRRDNYIL